MTPAQASNPQPLDLAITLPLIELAVLPKEHFNRKPKFNTGILHIRQSRWLQMKKGAIGIEHCFLAIDFFFFFFFFFGLVCSKEASNLK